MKILCVYFTLCIFGFSFAEDSQEAYQFTGVHFIASYYGCNSAALHDGQALEKALQEAVIRAGAHILNTSSYAFTPSGLTIALLLSESHATIHTYPEQNSSCFIDLFTCGTSCDAKAFDAYMQEFLQPLSVSKHTFFRD